jgi:hypothetical protein
LSDLAAALRKLSPDARDQLRRLLVRSQFDRDAVAQQALRHGSKDLADIVDMLTLDDDIRRRDGSVSSESWKRQASRTLLISPDSRVRGSCYGDFDMPRQSRDELLEHLQEQMGFLRRSAQSFDDGNQSESKRMAAVLRTLLHNKGSSDSLVKQLGIQHQLKFLDTSTPDPQPSTHGAVLVERFDAGLGHIRMEEERAVFEAPLKEDADGIRGLQPFRFWWNRAVLQDRYRENFTREQLVLFVAHKVGGVHVDPKVPPRFNALTRLNSLGWGWTRTEEGHIAVVVPAGPTDTPLGNPIPVNIRQIAFEVDMTLTSHLSSGLVPV